MQSHSCATHAELTWSDRSQSGAEMWEGATHPPYLWETAKCGAVNVLQHNDIDVRNYRERGSALSPNKQNGHRHEQMIRMFDFMIALAMIFLLLPVLILVAAAIFVFDRGPVFFAHWRVGQGGTSYPCLKFRSMCVGAEEKLAGILASDPAKAAEWLETQKLQDDPRVTAIGAFLRRTSLDELPQLFNVLRGEMSLVGPRPVVPDELHRYGPYAAHYLATKPGLTGVWQMCGRSDTTYRRRVAADRLYSKKRSLPFNLWIMLATVPAVLLARGSR